MALRNPIRDLSRWLAASLAAVLTNADNPTAQTPPPDVAATFRMDGEPRQVATIDLALELARRERLRPRGQAALTHLIDQTLVADAAAKLGFEPSKADIRRRSKEIQLKLEEQKIDLGRFLAHKNMSREEFEHDYIAALLKHEKLVVESAGLRSNAEVTSDLLALWLDEAKEKAKVITDPQSLAAGIVARLGSKQLTLAQLGDVLLQTADRDAREQAVRQIVVRALLANEASKHGVTASQADIEAEIERRRAMIESDPKFNGVPYEKLLESQGSSVDQLRQSPVIRAQVYRFKLASARLDDAELDRRIAADRDAALRRYGARRQINVILTRASSTPNEFIPLDFPAALERTQAVHARLQEGMSFDVAAKIHSDDPASKVRGGDVGLHNPGSKSLPSEVVEAAFQLDPFVVSEPIRTAAGYYLAMVSRIEDQPDDTELRRRMRASLMQKYVLTMLEEANIELVANR